MLCFPKKKNKKEEKKHWTVISYGTVDVHENIPISMCVMMFNIVLIMLILQTIPFHIYS